MNERIQDAVFPRTRSSALLTHAGGLHARPSIRLTQVAKSFRSRVWIAASADGPWVDAKSIARVMTLKTPAHTQLHFQAEGGDALEATQALARLVHNDFAKARDAQAPGHPPCLRLRGVAASPGLAHGPLVLLDDGLRHEGAGGRATGEVERLNAAIGAASAELATLTRRAGETDAEPIIAFQIAMLEDPVVTDPAYQAIAAGAPAGRAWRKAMATLLAEYGRAGDAYFRARESDLRDMGERVSRHLAGEGLVPIAPGSIILAIDLPPSRFLELAWDAAGIALLNGSVQSHVALLARSRGLPMLVNVEAADLRGHVDAWVDAEDGELVVSPDAERLAHFDERRRRRGAAGPAAPSRAPLDADVRVMLNVSDLRELDGLDAGLCDGIGLARTELLLRSHDALGSEEVQLQAYRRLVEWAAGKPVRIRTFDAGGDKPLDGYTVPGESNPFLGLRGVRLSLLHPHLLLTQLRAIARAAALGPAQVLVPMVTSPDEMRRVRALLEAALQSLAAEGQAHGRPALGMMVEVPVAALAIDDFEVDFLSIGSNDLIQYLTAASRDAAALSTLQDPLQPAVLATIRKVVQSALARGLPVDLCGEMAGDERCLPALLELGLRGLSVSAGALPRVRSALAALQAAPPGGPLAAPPGGSSA
jgi:phosphotransferase system enzyme I (PtsI)